MKDRGRRGAGEDVPAWTIVSVATGLTALVVAVIGFYWDVAWHIDLGRDEEIFTPAHICILAGLVLLYFSGLAGIALATRTRSPTRLRLGPIRIPASSLALAGLGAGALTGFPLDELWHRAYGIDVTMWGPTHLTMILGAALSPIALWLALAEGGVRPGGGKMSRLAHLTMAAATLTGLSAVQGEFDFGVPQFQLLYQPVLISIAAAAGLIAARLALGRFGALGAAAGFIAIRGGLALLLGPGLGRTVPRFPLYIAAAIVVEAAARLGTARTTRFALASGAGIATAGLAAEWAWTAVWGRHDWTASLLPDALVVSLVGALGAAMLGARLGRAAGGVPAEPPARRLAAAAAVAAVVAAALLPLPRTTGEVTARTTLRGSGESAIVDVSLQPAGAAHDARWFEVLSWQGGGMHVTPMRRTGPGRYSSAAAVPIAGDWKSMLRLHRGAEVMALPVYLPADPHIGAPEIPATGRAQRFVADSQLLLREAHGGPLWPSLVAYTALAGLMAGWLTLLGIASAIAPVSGRGTSSATRSRRTKEALS